MKFIVSILALVALAQCVPVAKESESLVQSLFGSFINCANGDFSLCLKEKALLMTERARSLKQVKLAEGIIFKYTASDNEGRSYEPLSTDIQTRSQQVSKRLSEEASHLMENTELELSMGTGDDEEQGRSVGEGRDKKKKQIKEKLKMIIPLLAILKVKALILVTISLVVIAASLLKLAILAKLAFIAKVIVILKHLLSKHHSHEEAWVPHHEEHHGHGVEDHHGWDGGWARSRNAAQNLAYSAYNN